MADVCFDCAKEKGARIPPGHVYTAWLGECSFSGETVNCTDTRDFGVTRRLLERDEGLRYCGVDGFVEPIHKMDGLICPKCRIML